MRSLADIPRPRPLLLRRRTPEELAQAQAEWEAARVQRLAAHAAEQRRTWPQHLARCGAPERAAKALPLPTAGGYRETLATKSVEEWLQSGASFCVLSGFTGTGKTTAACLAFRASVRVDAASEDNLLEWDSWGGRFIRLSRLKRISSFHPGDQELFGLCCSARVLVLDEVGNRPGEVLTQHGLEVLEELIDRRDVPGKRTVLTTNLSLHEDPKRDNRESDFALFVNERVRSRIEREPFTYDCGNEDMRRGQAEVSS